MSKQDEFTKWTVEGIDNGFMQEIDKQMRLQYGIDVDVTEQEWKEIRAVLLGEISPKEVGL